MDLPRHSPPSRPAGPLQPQWPLTSWQRRWRRMSPLARDIAVVLVVKAIVLAVLWFAFFRAPVARHMTMDPDRVVERIVSPKADPEPGHAVR